MAAGNQQLADAAPTLVAGVTALDAGAQQLSTGAQTLDAGAQTLNEGAQTLNEGTQTAAEGSMQLSDGLQQFYDQGISKIVDALGGDTGKVFSRISPLMDAGRDYNNFTGMADGYQGTVHFIYRTDSIGDDK